MKKKGKDSTLDQERLRGYLREEKYDSHKHKFGSDITAQSNVALRTTMSKKIKKKEEEEEQLQTCLSAKILSVLL